MGSRLRIFAVVLLVVVMAAVFAGLSQAQTSSYVAAKAKVDQARPLLTQRPLEMSTFVQLLDEAHRLSPAVDHDIADLLRRQAILYFAEVRPDPILVSIDKAVTLNPRLASDDTLRQICKLFGSQAPAMAGLTKAKRLADEGSRTASKTTKVATPGYIPLPEGVVRPVSSPSIGTGVREAAPEHWPKWIHMAEPVDPRGPGAPAAVVTMLATIERSGSVSDLDQPTGPPELYSAATRALRMSLFRPFTYLGAPIVTTAQVEVHFGRP